MAKGLFGTDPWFEPKNFGYGAGWPCAWQGWLLLFLFIGAAIGLSLFAEQLGLVAFVVLLAAITIPFVWLAARHTRGGWRWRG